MPNQNNNSLYPNLASTFASFKSAFPGTKPEPLPTSSEYVSSDTTDVVTGTPAQYANIIRQKAKETGVSPLVLSSLLKTESNFNPSSSNINPKESSYGLAQINISAHPDVTKEQAQDPAFAISFAAKRLKTMIDKYGLYEGVQAYNTPGAIGSAQLKNYANKILAPTRTTPTKPIYNLPMSTQKNPTQAASLPADVRNLGTLTTDWGDSTRYEKSHPGIDIANKKGTPVGSFVQGTVTNVITGKSHGQKGYGNQVEVTDQWGNKHRYSHLSQTYVKVGQKVGKDQAVGSMGDSGSTYSPSGTGTGTHLDYRIVNAFNKYINPHTYLKNIS